MGVSLPAKRTVQKWLESMEFNPGFSEHFMENLGSKCEELSERARKCAIMFDEINVHDAKYFLLKKQRHAGRAGGSGSKK